MNYSPPLNAAITCRFSYAVARHLITAAAAYYVVLKFLFPGHFHPLSAHHSDMYIAAELAASNLRVSELVLYPRPLLMLFLSAAGDLGFEGSLTFFASIAVLNLAWLMAMTEILILKVRIPLLLAFTSFALAFSAPGFYISYTHDNGATLATFFGLIAIFAVESAPESLSWRRCLSLGVFSALSAFCKESFLPALEVYALIVVIRHRPRLLIGLGLLLGPVVAGALSIGHSLWVKSAFVAVTSDPQNAYRLGFSITSILSTFVYYAGAIATFPFISLCLLSALVAVYAGRFRILAVFTILAFSLYSPYLLLPNHLMQYYWWSPMVFLALLLPIAIAPNSAEWISSSSRFIYWKQNRYLRIGTVSVLYLVAAITVIDFSKFNQSEGQWFLAQQDLNRSLLASLRSIRSALPPSGSILVIGVEGPFHPWVHPHYLASETGFHGHWVMFQPAPAEHSASITRISFTNVLTPATINEFDAILVFDKKGKIVSYYNQPRAMRLSELNALGADEVSRLLANSRLLTAVLQGTMPGDASSAYTLGKDLFDCGCYSLAIRYLTRAAEPSDLGTANPYASFFLGKIYMQRAQVPAALSAFENAVRYDNVESKNPYFEIELTQARAAMQLKSPDHQLAH